LTSGRVVTLKATATIIEDNKKKEKTINLWGGNGMALVALLSSFAVALVVELALLWHWWWC